MRRDLVAFANSAGGVLVLGVAERGDQKELLLEGVPPSAGDAASWVVGAMQAIAHALPHPPVARTVACGEHLLWLIAIQRSQGPLVPISSPSEKWVYPIRTEAGTIDAPDYLVSDLLVGRRAQPTFEITSIAVCRKDFARNSIAEIVSVVLELQVDNASMVYAEGVILSFVSLHLELEPDTSRARALPANGEYTNRRILSPALRRELDFIDSPSMGFVHRVVNLEDLESYALKKVVLPPTRYPGNVLTAHSAIIVAHRNGPPTFFQFRYERPNAAWHEGTPVHLCRVFRPQVSVALGG